MSSDTRPALRLDVRRQLVLGYLVLRLANLVVVALNDEMSAAFGSIDIVIAAVLVIGLWKGNRQAWSLAMVFEGLTLAFLLLVTAAPWNAGVVALIALTVLRLAVLLQRPLRPKAPRRAAGAR